MFFLHLFVLRHIANFDLILVMIYLTFLPQIHAIDRHNTELLYYYRCSCGARRKIAICRGLSYSCIFGNSRHSSFCNPLSQTESEALGRSLKR